MRKAHIKVMQEIYTSVPKEYIDNLMIKVDRFENTKNIMRQALEDPEVSDDQKNRYKNLLLSGHLDVVDEVENPEINAKIQEYIEGRIIEEVEAGRLPKTTFKKLMKKGRKYDKRKQGEEA